MSINERRREGSELKTTYSESITEKDRYTAHWVKNGYLPPKKGPYTMQDYLEAKRITQKVLINDVQEDLKSLQKVSGVNSIKASLEENSNSVETSLNMKSGNETLNLSKKELNNGHVIKEKSIFEKPESIEERREIVKELKTDGYTQQERADRMGYSQSTISRDDKANKNKRKS